METPIIFDPTIEQLQAIVEKTSNITITDLSDDIQLALIHDTRINLRDARVRIEKTGKEYRADALKHQKAVILREKELIAIIEPEEIRLKNIEEEANTIRVRAARLALLPMRREQLLPFGDTTISDESVLDMDNDQFIIYLNQRQAQKNENDRLEIEAERKRLDQEALLERVRKQAEQDERDRIERAAKLDEERRIQAEAQKKHDADVAAQKIIEDAKLEAQRIEKESRDKILQEQAQAEARAREIAVREQQEKDEKLKKEKHEAFVVWAEEQGFVEDGSFEIKHTDGRIELWKRVAVYVD